MSEQGLLVRKMMRESDIWNAPLDQIRVAFAAGAPAGIPDTVQMDTVMIGTVSCERFCYKGEKANCIGIYYHGGGGCLGIYHSNREFVARLCDQLKMDLIMPDYRLAPEFTYPAAHEDALQVYQLISQSRDANEDIIVLGDSFGCMLALATVQKIREAGGVMPKKMAMITPFLDVTGTSKTYQSKAADDPFQDNEPLGLVNIYLGSWVNKAREISTVYENLKGLPPLLIHAAEYDVFSGDAELLYERASESGVAVEIKHWNEMWHIFHMQDTFVPESKTAVEELCCFLSE
jgi:Esterase/lipase